MSRQEVRQSKGDQGVFPGIKTQKEGKTRDF